MKRKLWKSLKQVIATVLILAVTSTGIEYPNNSDDELKGITSTKIRAYNIIAMEKLKICRISMDS